MLLSWSKWHFVTLRHLYFTRKWVHSQYVLVDRSARTRRGCVYITTLLKVTHPAKYHPYRRIVSAGSLTIGWPKSCCPISALHFSHCKDDFFSVNFGFKLKVDYWMKISSDLYFPMRQKRLLHWRPSFAHHRYSNDYYLNVTPSLTSAFINGQIAAWWRRRIQ